MPHTRFKPCRVTVSKQRYQVEPDGEVLVYSTQRGTTVGDPIPENLARKIRREVNHRIEAEERP